MPQLDLMMFFNQFFWFSLAYSFFFIFCVHFIIYPISFNLKFRKKLIKFLSNDISKNKSDVSDLLTLHDNTLLKTLNFSRSYITKSSNYASLWVHSNFKIVYQSEFFLDSCNLYIKTIGEKSFSLFIIDSLLKNI